MNAVGIVTERRPLTMSEIRKYHHDQAAVLIYIGEKLFIGVYQSLTIDLTPRRLHLKPFKEIPIPLLLSVELQSFFDNQPTKDGRTISTNCQPFVISGSMFIVENIGEEIMIIEFGNSGKLMISSIPKHVEWVRIALMGPGTEHDEGD